MIFLSYYKPIKKIKRLFWTVRLGAMKNRFFCTILISDGVFGSCIQSHRHWVLQDVESVLRSVVCCGVRVVPWVEVDGGVGFHLRDLPPQDGEEGEGGTPLLWHGDWSAWDWRATRDSRKGKTNMQSNTISHVHINPWVKVRTFYRTEIQFFQVQNWGISI